MGAQPSRCPKTAPRACGTQPPAPACTCWPVRELGAVPCLRACFTITLYPAALQCRQQQAPPHLSPSLPHTVPHTAPLHAPPPLLPPTPLPLPLCSAGHSDSVLGGAICDAARMLATFSFDDCVRLWALDSGQCINCIQLPDTPQVGSCVCGFAGQWSGIALLAVRSCWALPCFWGAPMSTSLFACLLTYLPTYLHPPRCCSTWRCRPTAGRWLWR